MILVLAQLTLFFSKLMTTEVLLRISWKCQRWDRKVLQSLRQKKMKSCNRLFTIEEKQPLPRLIIALTVIPFLRRRQAMRHRTRRDSKHLKRSNTLRDLIPTKTQTWGLSNVQIQAVLGRPGVSNLLLTKTWYGKLQCWISKRTWQPCKSKLSKIQFSHSWRWASKSQADLRLVQSTKTFKMSRLTKLIKTRFR